MEKISEIDAKLKRKNRITGIVLGLVALGFMITVFGDKLLHK